MFRPPGSTTRAASRVCQHGCAMSRWTCAASWPPSRAGRRRPRRRARHSARTEMLLIDAARLTERGGIARGALAPLHDSLREDLQPVLAPRPEVPRVKALLSRAGGRCENDGTLLDFDPRSPNVHRCPRCGTLHEGEVHHRAWVTNFQLWLAERAVHAAMFAALDGNARHAEFARDVLREYADCYEEYPNRDNVLGPTRLFFSTYL